MLDKVFDVILWPFTSGWAFMDLLWAFLWGIGSFAFIRRLMRL